MSLTSQDDFCTSLVLIICGGLTTISLTAWLTSYSNLSPILIYITVLNGWYTERLIIAFVTTHIFREKSLPITGRTKKAEVREVSRVGGVVLYEDLDIETIQEVPSGIEDENDSLRVHSGIDDGNDSSEVLSILDDCNNSSRAETSVQQVDAPTTLPNGCSFSDGTDGFDVNEELVSSKNCMRNNVSLDKNRTENECEQTTILSYDNGASVISLDYCDLDDADPVPVLKKLDSTLKESYNEKNYISIIHELQSYLLDARKQIKTLSDEKRKREEMNSILHAERDDVVDLKEQLDILSEEELRLENENELFAQLVKIFEEKANADKCTISGLRCELQKCNSSLLDARSKIEVHHDGMNDFADLTKEYKKMKEEMAQLLNENEILCQEILCRSKDKIGAQKMDEINILSQKHKMDLHHKEETIKRLSQQLDEATSLWEETRKKLASCEQEKNEMKEISEQEKDSSRDELESQAKNFLEQIEDIKGPVDSLNQEKADLILKLDSSLEALNKMRETSQQERNSSRDELESQAKNFLEQIEDITGRADSLNQEKADLISKLDSSLEALKKTKERLFESDEDYDDLKEQLDILSEEELRLGNENKLFAQIVKICEEKANADKCTISGLRCELQKCNSSLLDARSKIEVNNNAGEAINFLETEKKIYHDGMNESTKELQKMKEEMAQLLNENEILRHSKDIIGTQKMELNILSQEQEMDLHHKEETIKNLSQQFDELTSMWEETRKKLASCEQEKKEIFQQEGNLSRDEIECQTKNFLEQIKGMKGLIESLNQEKADLILKLDSSLEALQERNSISQ